MKTTLVFGASMNPARFSNKAIHRLVDLGHEVVAIGGRDGAVKDVEILTGHPEVGEIDTVTMYIGPLRQQDHEDYILSLQPTRIIFNPGAENRPFAHRARQAGIETINACTLVMLNTGQY